MARVTENPKKVLEQKYLSYIEEIIKEVYSDYLPEVKRLDKRSLKVLNEMTQGFGRVLTKEDFIELKLNPQEKMKDFHISISNTGFDEEKEKVSVERYKEKFLDLAMSIDNCNQVVMERQRSRGMSM